MKTTYEKSCDGEYLTSYGKNNNLLRSAELINNSWIVHTYYGIDIGGEYTENEFKKIRKYFNSNE